MTEGVVLVRPRANTVRPYGVMRWFARVVADFHVRRWVVETLTALGRFVNRPYKWYAKICHSEPQAKNLLLCELLLTEILRFAQDDSAGGGFGWTHTERGFGTTLKVVPYGVRFTVEAVQNPTLLGRAWKPAPTGFRFAVGLCKFCGTTLKVVPYGVAHHRWGVRIFSPPLTNCAKKSPYEETSHGVIFL